MGQKIGTNINDNKTYNVLVLGLDNSGKSSIVNCVKTSTAGRKRSGGRNSSTPTIGFRLERIKVNSCVMTLIDMSGQGRYRNLWEYYYKDCHAIVFVVDSSDRKRMPVACEEKDLMLLHPAVVDRVIPILIFSNKMDREEALTCDELTRVMNMPKHSGSKPWKVLPSSAITGDGVVAGFEWLADQLAID